MLNAQAICVSVVCLSDKGDLFIAYPILTLNWQRIPKSGIFFPLVIIVPYTMECSIHIIFAIRRFAHIRRLSF